MKYNFKKGDIVVAIATDDFYPDKMHIGSQWEVLGAEEGGTFLVLSTKGTALADDYPQVTAYTWKFAPLEEFQKDQPGAMEAAFEQYEEAIAGQELMEG